MKILEIKHRIAIILLFLLSPTSFLCAQSLNTKIDNLIQQTLPNAYVGVLIQNAQTGKVIYSKNAEKLFYPASSVKLFTAAAALYQLSSNYRFTSSLFQQNHDYYLTFNGSPSFKHEDLKKLLQPLLRQKIHHIYIDDSRFKRPYIAAGTSYDDLGWYFDAPVSSIIINENAVAYEIKTTQPGHLVNIKSLTPNSPITIVNQITTANKNELHCQQQIEILPQNTLLLYGCLPQNKTSKHMSFAISDPYFYTQQFILKELKSQGLTKKQISRRTLPSQAKKLKVLYSSTIQKIIQHMLEESDNVYAGDITKQLGFIKYKNGSFDKGTMAIKSIIQQYTHVDINQIQLEDGIGTRYNLIPPKQMVTLLSDIYHDKKMRSLFLASLPKMGVSGTLKNRMKQSTLKNKIFAKTGTMRDISSLSGFLNAPNGQVYVFSIMINNVNSTSSFKGKTQLAKAKELEENILLSVS